MENKIQAKNLRIGNVIFFPFHNENVEVVGLPLDAEEKLQVQVRTRGSIVMSGEETFLGIPITAELLKEKGFMQSSSFPCFCYAGGIDIIHDEKYQRVLMHIAGRMKYLDYFHELQNALDPNGKG